MENIHPVLYAIINLYLKSETAGSLDPAVLGHIGNFMGTLRKIYTFVEAQQDQSKIKYLFRNNEMQNLLKDCHVGLDQAVEVFAINTRPAIANDIDEMKKTAKTMHEELLELIQTVSDTSTNSDGSSVYLGTNDLKNSSNSFSMLPSKPKIFYGRESELDHIMKMIAQQPARIAILGGGGMGKTSLAKVVLHHPETSTKFESRFFVNAESVTTSIELAALIGLHIGLDSGKDLTRAVVQYFSRAPSLLLILDNLETVWDPIQSRGGIEEFLSLLTDVEHLTLIVCPLVNSTLCANIKFKRRSAQSWDRVIPAPTSLSTKSCTIRISFYIHHTHFHHPLLLKAHPSPPVSRFCHPFPFDLGDPPVHNSGFQLFFKSAVPDRLLLDTGAAQRTRFFLLRQPLMQTVVTKDMHTHGS
ncbi:hypothetical protein B0H14DRAFT_2498178 [Mycena olivaceomarginata]|nr:hypothetical protein B0H14DRAFT_2498178 [Mycena olivaceomarginata]